ncbi:MAG: hypothetical protein PHP23_06390 [Desulfobacterales bacterium]|nr:hypothetical protein [Desulfobacterales bacterium]MDD4073179.1 hypothetical protein [Desulfobacterales bacterium]MDD4393634.1 hypothetical protein [Desulfobacterales bacterium]
MKKIDLDSQHQLFYAGFAITYWIFFVLLIMNNFDRKKNCNIAGLVFKRLYSRNLTQIEVRRLILDVQNILCDDIDTCTEAVNAKLTGLGWTSSLVDSVTFELIVYLIENEWTKDSYAFH